MRKANQLSIGCLLDLPLEELPQSKRQVKKGRKKAEKKKKKALARLLNQIPAVK